MSSAWVGPRCSCAPVTSAGRGIGPATDWCLLLPSQLPPAPAPAGGVTLYDYQLAFRGGRPELRPWSASVPTFTYSKAVPYFQMLVPTVETVGVGLPGLLRLRGGRGALQLAGSRQGVAFAWAAG